MTVFSEFFHDLIRNGLERFKRYYSFYDAVVVDNNDPDKLGRVKFVCSELELEPDYFAFPLGVWNGSNNSGVFAPPTNGAHIHIRFKYGDIQYPYYSMAYAYQGSYPKEGIEDYGKKFGFVTPEGIAITCNDNNKSVLIKLPNNTSLHITESGISLGQEDKANEPVVLGNKNRDVLLSIQEILTTLTSSVIAYGNSQSAVAAGTQILAPLSPALQVLASSLTNITDDIALLPKDIETTLSSKNTTD